MAFQVIPALKLMANAAPFVATIVAAFKPKNKPKQIENIMSISETDILIEKYGNWGEHPDYRVANWGFEAGMGDTRRGYWEWVTSKIEQEKDEKPQLVLNK